MRIEGRCHCGNLHYVLKTSLQQDQLPVRACDCSFCRAHGARATSDPRGQVRIGAELPDLVSRYGFPPHTCEFLVCARCGVYVAAVIEARGERRATLNLGASALRDLPAKPVSYGAETAEQRIERRLAGWTPVVELKI